MTINNQYQIILSKGRGSSLYLNKNTDLLQIEVSFHTSTSENNKDLTVNKYIGDALNNSIIIIGNLLTRLGHTGIASKNGYKVIIPSNEQFMIINRSEDEMRLILSEESSTLEELYNPYKFENETHQNFDPEEFKKENPVPDGYMDTLAKWYSIKFSYRNPDENIIFIRPGVGISFQTHMKRAEHWEIIKGSPIIVAGAKVHYDVKIEAKFDMQLGELHTIINPSTTEWACIKETFTGTFDEEDIIRVFNPNNFN